ncbi:MAG: GTP-binding protein [archaeon]|nr:GTP-binding protein [archaeon]
MQSSSIDTNTPGRPKEIKVEYLPEDNAQYDLSFKLIIIGDSGVGKSCLSTKAVKDSYSEYYQATVGFEFLTFNLKLDELIVKLQIWDTCGQEIYRSLITNFYRNSSLAILVYSIDNEESFKNITSWLTELKKQANPDIKTVLVGNKCDLEDKRKISKEDGENLRKSKNIDLFMECSAKTGLHTKSMLVESAKLLYQEYLDYQKKHGKGAGFGGTPDPDKINLKSDDVQGSNKRCCMGKKS